MPIVTCMHDECDQDLIANDEDAEGYCPEHSGGMISHGSDHASRQHENQREMEDRHRIVSGDVWKDIE